ncbi:MAG: acetate/propionate family kinase [Candidatus Eremiobacteraeota bacterium]|nr:acetate/propionate family kinase [Candidatus Eremiobacteraeota bacterium]
MRILCLNGGSSSLKFAAYRCSESKKPVRIASGEAAAGAGGDAALAAVLSQIQMDESKLAAVGHRLVFGGSRYVVPTRANDEVLHELEALVAVEPLHLRAELDLVYAAGRRFPGVPQILCFDTAFHRRSPAIARRLPLPRDLDPLVERYGFHGLSYEYIASELDADSGRTVVAHLGSGASLCALCDRAPIDTTMGFSALGGLMMGTRPGDLDPGIVLRLLDADGYDAERLADLFYNRSGLLGVSGSTADMRTLVAQAPRDALARAALDLFVYQLVKHLGAMVAVLGGLDTLVFTAGIGERAPAVRAAACDPFAYLGLRLDGAANDRNERIISDGGSSVTVLVIPTDENMMIARHTMRMLVS